MTTDETLADAAVYTARDMETHLSHLANWYGVERDWRHEPYLVPEHAEAALFHLCNCRNVRGYNGGHRPEFSRCEALHMYRRLYRRRENARDDEFVIRPKRLVAAIRALRTRQAKLDRKSRE